MNFIKEFSFSYYLEEKQFKINKNLFKNKNNFKE